GRHTRSKRDWSSDVCSSDLFGSAQLRLRAERPGDVADLYVRQRRAKEKMAAGAAVGQSDRLVRSDGAAIRIEPGRDADARGEEEIGRASCRERVWIAVVAGA